MRDDAEHLLADVVAVDRVDVEPVEHRGCRLDARLFVIDRSDPSVDERGRRRLAEIVADGAEHHDDLPGAIEVVDPRARLIDHQQRVDPDVALGMPLRLLLASDERVDLREEPLDDAEIEREREAHRRPGAPGAGASRLPPRSARTADRRAESGDRDRALSGSSANSKRAANCIARSTRRLSSPKVREIDRAQELASMSARPLNGSMYSPVSGSQAIALIVKSRRRAASSNGRFGSPTTSNPRCPRPVRIRVAAARRPRRRPCRR